MTGRALFGDADWQLPVRVSLAPGMERVVDTIVEGRCWQEARERNAIRDGEPIDDAHAWRVPNPERLSGEELIALAAMIDGRRAPAIPQRHSR